MYTTTRSIVMCRTESDIPCLHKTIDQTILID